MTNEEALKLVGRGHAADELIITALQRQIPKKTTRKGYRDGCPVCSVIFRENDFGIHYCWNCGTKLDWSE